MSYDREHYYLTWGGPLFQAEQWQVGAHFASPTGEDILQNAFDQISLDDIKTILTTWMTSGSSGAKIGSAAKMDFVKLAVIGRDGRYKFEPKLLEIAPVVTPPQTTTLPAQVAYVVTLWSGERLGHANYGRFYVPTPSSAVGQNPDGRLDPSECTGMRNAAISMLNGVNGEISTLGVPTRPYILSKLGTGTSKEVQHLSVGRVLDTQRRRRNHLAEDPVFADV